MKCHHSSANLTEGRVFFYWEGPRPEALIAWFNKMEVPYDTITKLEQIADNAGAQDV